MIAISWVYLHFQTHVGTKWKERLVEFLFRHVLAKVCQESGPQHLLMSDIWRHATNYGKLGLGSCIV